MVFSTFVEVFLNSALFWRVNMGILHVRGGVSKFATSIGVAVLFSPRSWRCFCGFFDNTQPQEVFSTFVEVFLYICRTFCLIIRFLHVRGGVSTTSEQNNFTMKFSPRSWRCFLIIVTVLLRMKVFSTFVEVFLNIRHLPA